MVLILGLVFALPAAGRAQNGATSDESANPVSSDGQINQPSLKELMATNNVVTNTVGIVLVKISPMLWAGRYEVTQESYEKVMGGNPSAFKGE